MKNFKDAKWLIENIDDKDTIILDVRAALTDPLEGKREYDRGHIRGASYVSLEDVLTGKLESHGGRHPLPDLNKFIDHMKKLGVKDSSKVIIYDDGTLAMAGRLWYIFKLIGKEDVYILEGGIRAYIENGGPTTRDLPLIEESSDLSLKLNEDMLVDVTYVKEKINDPHTAIVDVRAHERYIGKVEPLDPVAGHIRGALNYPWTELIDEEEKINLDLIEDKFKDLKDYREIIIHCGSGITGTVAMVLLDEIGQKPTLYAGGYSDWVSYKDNEVVQGEN